MESLQFLINGLMLGGLYAMIGAGFALVYGVMNVLNLAHGSFIMLGAYVTYWTVTLFDVHPVLAIPVAAVVLFALGFATQRLLISRVLQRSIFMTFILTFGLDMLLINGIAVAWGGTSLSVNSPLAGRSIDLGGLLIPSSRLVVLVVAMLAIFWLLWFLSRTRIGLAVKATALHREAAQLAGIDINLIFGATFAIAAALAGIAGSLHATLFPIDPYMGVPLAARAFAVAVLGGLGSATGALLAGFLLAFAEIAGVTFMGAGWSDGVAFGILLLTFLVRPQGLMGKQYYAEVKV